MLEKGGYHSAQEGGRGEFQQWGEAEAMASTLERGGVMASKDGNIMVRRRGEEREGGRRACCTEKRKTNFNYNWVRRRR